MKVRRIKRILRNIALACTLLFLFFGILFLIALAITRPITFTIGVFVALFLGFLIGEILDKTANILGQKTKQASSEELKREDDVLLQAVALSQSVFFIYLNLIEVTDIVITFKIVVPIFAVLFYVLRAWGKIKDNAKYRYHSIWVFYLIVLVAIMWVATEVTTRVVGKDNATLIVVGIFLGTSTLGLYHCIEAIFKKRYGYQR